jgi:hypothetical protein
MSFACGRTRFIVTCLFVIAFLLPAAIACNRDAQGTAGGSSRESARAPANRSNYSPLSYPLDDAKVRKVAAVMRAWDPKGPPPKSEDPKELAAYWGKLSAGSDFTNKIGKELIYENSTATVDSTPELKAAIEKQEMSSREFVEAALAYTNALGALDVEGLEKFYGKQDGKPAFTPTGVFKENVELVRRMNKEEELPSW